MVYKKEIFQFLRDTDDENDWLEEKMRIVSDEEFGTSLQEVNLLIKKIKTLKGEIDNHEPRIRAVCEDGQRLIDRGHPDSDAYRAKIDDLKEKLGALMEMLEARRAKLLVSEKAQQFFFDANEAEAWMSEQVGKESKDIHILETIIFYECQTQSAKVLAENGLTKTSPKIPHHMCRLSWAAD